MAKKLIVTLEIIMGDGEPENYDGLLEEMLEESQHWGDFQCTVLNQTLVDDDDGSSGKLGFFDTEGYKG